MADVGKSFEENEIVPKIIPNAPKELFPVNYDGINIELGTELKPRQSRFMPKVHYKGACPDDMYALIMIDPDSLSKANPRCAEWLHWLVVNIPGNNMLDGLIGGNSVMNYTGPTPGERTDLHRYILLLWHQTGRLGVNAPASRQKFKVAAFMEKHKLGDPIAGNFYQAQWEPTN